MKVAGLQVVVCFARDEQILFSRGEAIQGLAKRLRGRIQQLNVPHNAPDQTPRAVIQSSDTILSVSYDRIDIRTQPPSHVSADYNSVLDFCRLRCEPFITTLFQKQGLDYTWLGVVSTVRYPVGGKRPGVEATEGIFDQLINFDRREKKLSAFQLQFGLADSKFFRTYTISGYETRNLVVSALKPVGSTMTINADDLPMVESGIQVLLDVNNKPDMTKCSVIEDFKSILVEHNAAFPKMEADLKVGGNQ